MLQRQSQETGIQNRVMIDRYAFRTNWKHFEEKLWDMKGKTTDIEKRLTKVKKSNKFNRLWSEIRNDYYEEDSKQAMKSYKTNNKHKTDIAISRVKALASTKRNKIYLERLKLDLERL